MEKSETSKTDKKASDKKETSSDSSEEAENQETVDKSEEKETPENFKLAVSVGNFKPEHLKLTVSEGKLSIVGKYVHETDHGNGIYSTEERQFRQSYTLPDNVNTDQLISKFDESGRLLTFEAPLKAIEEPKERPIPITVEKPTVSIECPESSADVEGDKSTKSEQFAENSENVETTTEKESESDGFESNSDAGSE
ncbi:heat shock protein 30C-like [Ptychodera flava]|uniref:heat shock protein 30C-like n=1 Tax=Ptychodera flava TaxID=63121 RepID=UPI00396A6610